MVDFKTASRRFGNLIDKYTTDIQFTMGQFLWNLENPRHKAKGTLVDMAIMRKPPVFDLLVVPAIGEHEMDILRAQMQLAVRRRDEAIYWPNESQCNYYKTCCYKYTECNRLPVEVSNG